MPVAKLDPKSLGYRLFHWANQENSVFDPLYEQVARRVVKDTGLDFPEGAVLGGEMAAPLISIYKNKTERNLGLGTFYQLVKDFPQHYQDAFTRFAQKYPRIAAHMRPERELTNFRGNTAEAMVPLGKVERPIPVKITEHGLKLGPDDAINTVFHEGTHVAQALGNKDMKELYHPATILRGYHRNPFEIAANRNQPITKIYRKSSVLYPPTPPQRGTVMDLLRQAVDVYLPEEEGGFGLPESTAERNALKRIQYILKNRAERQK